MPTDKKTLGAVPVEVVSEVDGNEDPGGRGVDGHVVGGVVQELGACVPLHVVRVIVAPSQLDVQPVLLRGAAVFHVSATINHLYSIPTIFRTKKTSRDRPKSAPCLGLKNSKSVRYSLLQYRIRKKTGFFLKSPVSRIVPKM